ncbi:hypothetical protein BDV11DRAFT_205945 [Aspergillus similis]
MRSIALSFALSGTLLAQSSQALVKVVTSTRVECSPISTNLLSDPSFETEELGAWTPWFGTPTVVSDNSDAGEYALTITSPSSPYRSIRQTVTGLTVGTSYTLSFDYRIKELLLVQGPATCLMYLEYDNNRVLASGSYNYVPGVTPEWTTISGTLTASATEHSFVMWGFCGSTTVNGPVLEYDNARFERPLVDGEPTESCSTLTDSSTATYTPTPTRTPTPSPVAPTSVLTTTTPSSTPLIVSPPSSAPTSPSVTPSRTPSRSPVTRSSSIPVIASSSNPENTFTRIPVSVPSPSPVRRLPQPLPEHIDCPEHAYCHDHRLPANSNRLSCTEHLCLNRNTRRVNHGSDCDSQCPRNCHRAADSSGSDSGSASSPGSPSEIEPLTAPKQDTKVPSGPGAIPPPPPSSGSAYYPIHSLTTGSTTMAMTKTTPAGAEFTGSASAFKQDILLTIAAAFAPLFFLFF